MKFCGRHGRDGILIEITFSLLLVSSGTWSYILYLIYIYECLLPLHTDVNINNSFP